MISFTWWQTLLIGLMFVMPFALPLLLVASIWMWGGRNEKPWRFWITLVVTVSGAVLVACTWGVMVWDKFLSAREESFWSDISVLAEDGHTAEALDRLAGHGPDAMRHYVYRSFAYSSSMPNPALLREVFGRCVDLLPNEHGGDSWLGDVVEGGHVVVLEAWLASAECPRPEGQTREQALRGRVMSLSRSVLPFSRDNSPEQHSRQAAALRVLVQRYPGLLDVETPDAECAFSRESGLQCNLLSLLFLGHHAEGVTTLWPLDAKVERHLPAFVLPSLKGDVAEAAKAVAERPAELAVAWPSMIALLPEKTLRELWNRVQISEGDLLAWREGKTDQARLKPMFEQAARRDDGAAEWTQLWLLLDMLPQHLASLEPDLFEGYVSYENKTDDRNVKRLLETLRSAGQSCQQLWTAAKGGGYSSESKAWHAAQIGCAEPAN